MKASAKLLIAVVTTMLCTVIPAQTPRSGSDVFKLVEAEENGVSPPVRLSDVQLQFDFGDI